MRHARFDVASIAVEQVPVPLRSASLQVVQADGTDQLQWECLVYAVEGAPIAPGRYRIDVKTLDGRLAGGDAIRVRSVDGAHVFRGDGPLEGLGADDLV